jgi:hypothetical protein
VPECHVITRRDGQVANLIVHVPEEGEHLRPVPQLRLYPHVLKRRLDVEGHDVRRIQPPQAFEILGLDSCHDLVDLLPDPDLVLLALRGHRYPSLLIGAESSLLHLRRNSRRECQARGLEEGLLSAKPVNARAVAADGILKPESHERVPRKPAWQEG